MSRSLEGKFGIVTGGSRGIGAAIAKNLASKGCSLLLNFTSESSRAPTESLCNQLTTTHSIRCVSVQADLSTPEDGVAKIMAAVSTHFPNTPIDILINNAGVSADRTLNDPEAGPIDAPYFNWHYTINVLAPLLLTQAVAPLLPTNRSGRIVNISSVSSSLGFIGQSVYGGTKAALEAMTRTWARELADRATVNAINPGPVTGDMYFKTSEGFWNHIQGYQDNTPLSKLVGEDDPSLEGLTESQIGIIREKMGGRRPAFTEENFQKMPPRPSTLLPTHPLRRAHLAFRTRIPQSPLHFHHASIPAIQPSWNLTPIPRLNSSIIRPFSSTPAVPLPGPSPGQSTTSGKSQADLIVEELQELYESTTDELEIATESTSDDTIYAASDRASARDALDSLVAAYELYTNTNTNISTSSNGGDGAIEGGEGRGPLVELAFDPVGIEAEVREEVRRRVGQRVREVKSAVEGLEAKG
ncbi:hypothetical protein BDW59DRAFT_169504 [Aspergillus cavernicola]|uniref:Ketoreductase domain-containing protein n=1 Tax=Aspergillus cavernicola TaxID=176166 RepID=A0ABR4IWG1_9EURO